MSERGRFIKNLLSFNVLFGIKSKKLSGINDATHTVTANMTITAPDQIQLASAVPNFLAEGRFFRITGGGGANEDELFQVLSVSGDTITVDTAINSVSAFAGLATIDARFATVHDDETISKLSAKGNTIFNVNNYTTTGNEDCSSVAEACADHYHDPPAELTPVCVDFELTDWFSTDMGDTFSIDVAHDLNTLVPSIHIFEDGTQEVWAHAIRIIDANTVRIKVTQMSADCRFAGKVKISAL